MDKNRFNCEVRPYVVEIPIGKQGVAFDRLDLDGWAEDYKTRNGRPGKAMKGGTSWDRKSPQDSSNVVESGIFRRQSKVRDFEKALARAVSQRPNDT